MLGAMRPDIVERMPGGARRVFDPDRARAVVPADAQAFRHVATGHARDDGLASLLSRSVAARRAGDIAWWSPQTPMRTLSRKGEVNEAKDVKSAQQEADTKGRSSRFTRDPKTKKRTTKKELVSGEGGTAVTPGEMRTLLLGQIKRHGGLTVAVYVGDESGESAEFRSQGYKFARQHGAIGVTRDGRLVSQMAMEMTASTADQLLEITSLAAALLATTEDEAKPGEEWTAPVRVATLAILTHGWEEGVRVKVNEHEAQRFREGTIDYSDKMVVGLSGDAVYPWIARVAQYLSASPTIILYACRTAGDLDSPGEMTVWERANNIKDPVKRAAEIKRLTDLHLPSGSFQDMPGWTSTQESMGGAMPLAGRVLEGLEQALVRRQIAEHEQVSLDVLEKRWLAVLAKAEAGKERMSSRERDRWITLEATDAFAAATPGYASALKVVRARPGGMHVWSHLDRGNTTGNSRLAEFRMDALDAKDPSSKSVTRTTFINELAMEIAGIAMQHKHFEAYDGFSGLVSKLGGTTVATRPDGNTLVDRLDERKKNALANAEKKIKDPAALAAMKIATQARYAADKAAIKAHWSELARDEEATSTALREIPFIGSQAVVAMLVRPSGPSVADLANVDLTTGAKPVVLRGLQIFHRDVQAIMRTWVSTPAQAPAAR
jgi:hypothetical protein